MRTSPPSAYRPALTLRKAFFTWFNASIAAGVGVAAVKCPTSWAELKATWPTLIIPLALAAYRAFRNWRKHHAPAPPSPPPGPNSSTP